MEPDVDSRQKRISISFEALFVDPYRKLLPGQFVRRNAFKRGFGLLAMRLGKMYGAAIRGWDGSSIPGCPKLPSASFFGLLARLVSVSNFF